MKHNIKSYILKSYPNWVAGGTIERQEFWNSSGLAKPSTISRMLRKLAEDGEILKRTDKGYVEYCSKMKKTLTNAQIANKEEVAKPSSLF